MGMRKYKEDIKRANKELEKEVERLERLVCERYQPIFDRVTARIQKLMQSQGILRINLSPTRPKNLYFSIEGMFEIGTQGIEIDLESVARAYQVENMEEQNTQNPQAIRIQDALEIALDDVVNKSQEAYIKQF